jgi:hypothetical protein
MKNPSFETKPEAQSLPTESLDRLRLINDTNRMLERLSDFGLETPEGRQGLKVVLDLVFSNIDKIEGSESYTAEDGSVTEDTEYEVIGVIRGRVRDLYRQLYGIKFHNSGTEMDKVEFYSEIEEVMEVIEQRGQRFVKDMEEYKTFNEEKEVA